MKVKNLLDDNENKPEQQTLPVEVFAPWANIVVRFKIPDNIFANLLELYEEINSSKWKSFGTQLVGQIEDEPEVTPELQDKYPLWTQFCNDAARNFVMTQTQTVMQAEPKKWADFLNDEVYTRITTMWFVKQKPGEYNPVHIHTNCKVSAIAYVKTPKQQVKDRKQHYEADGRVTFMNNSGTDLNFAASQCTFQPKAGDMYVFPALQHHMVWPYRSADPNDERVSISFNADMITRSGLERKEKEQQEMMKRYEEHKQKSENEKLNLNNEVKNDKSTDVSNVNKSG